MKKKEKLEVVFKVPKIEPDVFVNSYKLTATGKKKLKNQLDLVLSDVKSHFKNDKWDLNASILLSEVVDAILPGIENLVISNILHSNKNLTLQIKDGELKYTLNNKRKVSKKK